MWGYGLIGLLSVIGVMVCNLERVRGYRWRGRSPRKEEGGEGVWMRRSGNIGKRWRRRWGGILRDLGQVAWPCVLVWIGITLWMLLV